MSDDPLETFDATDPAAEANSRRELARRERADLDVMRGILSTTRGRDWLYRFLDSCHINNTPFAPGQPDVTAYHLGEEAVGKRILLLGMAASTDLYMKMIKEQQEEEQRLAEVRRKERMNREEREGPVDVHKMMVDLPPPAGYPGGPPLPKKPGKK